MTARFPRQARTATELAMLLRAQLAGAEGLRDGEWRPSLAAWSTRRAAAELNEQRQEFADLFPVRWRVCPMPDLHARRTEPHACF
jgi:hypothetical protein